MLKLLAGTLVSIAVFSPLIAAALGSHAKRLRFRIKMWKKARLRW